jgi:hypothetical protein
MHIKAGYEIAYDCAGPTPMLLVLSIHPSRVPDLLTPHQITFDRDVVPYDYVDGFGNVCNADGHPARSRRSCRSYRWVRLHQESR